MIENKKKYIVSETPIEYLGRTGKADIYIKRDDLIGFSLGGNKVRIGAEIFDEIVKGGYTSVVSYGSYTSNLNRVIAHFACRSGIKAYIVCKEEKSVKAGVNMRMAEYSGAEYIFCDESNVKETLEKTMNISRSRGEKPYYVYGDSSGSGNEAVLIGAYKKAYDEITDYSQKTGIEFDSIYLACGTGMTQSGIIAGILCRGGREKVTGISVARNKERAEEVIDRNLKLSGFKDSILRRSLIKVNDEYICGGYGQYDSEIADLVIKLISKYGIPMDPVYTGKAFYGMLSEIKNNKSEGNILFIHTGGTAGFFDFLRASKEEIK